MTRSTRSDTGRTRREKKANATKISHAELNGIKRVTLVLFLIPTSGGPRNILTELLVEAKGHNRHPDQDQLGNCD